MRELGSLEGPACKPAADWLHWESLIMEGTTLCPHWERGPWRQGPIIPALALMLTPLSMVLPLSTSLQIGAPSGFQGSHPSQSIYFFFPLEPKFSSVAQSCPTLCDPMDCSTRGFPVPESLLVSKKTQLLELTQTHVHWVGDGIQPSYSLSSPSPPAFQSFPASGSFQMSQLFPSDGQSIGVSASASVLPMHVQDWIPLGWTGWISLQSKGLSRVFSSITVQKHQFFDAQLSLWPNSHIHTRLLEKS